MPNHYTFALKAKDVRFGERCFEQWWMDRRTIYPLRGQSASNFRTLIDFFWQSCLENETYVNRSVCESYILAQSLPFTRSNGARNVVLDSLVQRENARNRTATDSNLESMLHNSFDEEVSIVDFQRRLQDYLQQRPYTEEVWDQLSEFKSELFDQSVATLQRGERIDVEDCLKSLWARWGNRVRRKNALEVQRQMMDVLSYESKAAIHRCYSHFWDHASRWMAHFEQCSVASFVFHRFWNTDLMLASDDPWGHSDFHLLYGHVFGLHPGTYSFMRTTSGQKLLGDWLSIAPVDWQHSGNPETPQLRRLLNGLNIAIIDYSNRVGLNREDRRQLDSTSRNSRS